jgi:hypothetical protein
MPIIDGAGFARLVLDDIRLNLSHSWCQLGASVTGALGVRTGISTPGLWGIQLFPKVSIILCPVSAPCLLWWTHSFSKFTLTWIQMWIWVYSRQYWRFA